MPIFEYECRECDHRFEHLQRTADALVACPVCETENVQRLVSLCAVSSEASRAANLTAAHQRAAKRRDETHQSEHRHHHDHFEDAAKPNG
jgi:putative FmdB family regulatory protein